MRLMFASFLSGFIIFSVFAWPFDAESTGHFHLTWIHDKIDSRVSIIAIDNKEHRLVGYKCTTFNATQALTSGNFASLPLVMEVDGNGFGRLEYAGTIYEIHQSPSISGGITCTKTYNDQSAQVDCVLPWKSDHAHQGSSLDNLDHCVLPYIQSTWLSSQQHTTMIQTKRQPPTDICDCNHETILVGDGNPHQNYLHKQLSVSVYTIYIPS